MAKKVRFPLEMDNGISVRDLTELKSNFSITRVVDYYMDGKLLIWLRDRYYNDIADEIEKLQKNDINLPQNLCNIFGIENQPIMDIEEIKERQEKLEKLKQYTAEKKYIDNIDKVAFEQDELYDLLDSNQKTIYLCNEKFVIPLSQENIEYIGINNPTVVIESEQIVDFNQLNIKLSSIKFDEKYQMLLDNSNLNTKNSTSTIGDYNEKTDINFMITKKQQESSKNLYYKVANEINNIVYDPDRDIKEIKEYILNSGIFDMGKDFIERL